MKRTDEVELIIIKGDNMGKETIVTSDKGLNCDLEEDKWIDLKGLNYDNEVNEGLTWDNIEDEELGGGWNEMELEDGTIVAEERSEDIVLEINFEDFNDDVCMNEDMEAAKK